MKKTLLTSILLVYFMTFISAQKSSLYVTPNSNFESGMIYLKDSYKPISALNIFVDANEVLYYTEEDTDITKSMELASNVKYLKIPSGNQVAKYAGYGLALGAASTAIWVVDYILYVDNDIIVPILGGAAITAIAAGVGALIGINKVSYVNYFVKDKSLSQSLSIGPTLNAAMGPSLGLRIVF